MTAGFCWNWSDTNNDGTLVNDIVVGNYQRPWNAKPEAKRLASNIPKATLWAHAPHGINQVGCIYTAQGFEFDYVGVIIGKDLVYNFDTQRWLGNKEFSYDSVVKRSKESFVDLVKNTYRVLLTRGIKGCYVYFVDKETERFFKSRMEGAGLNIPDTEDNVLSLEQGILQEIDENQKFKEYLPVFSLKAVATSFGNEESVDQLGWMKTGSSLKLSKDMFIAQVVGKSMEPTIPDGSYCIFRFDKGGSRNGLVVLVESRLVSDPELYQRYTIKRYRSKKEINPDGTWKHKKIVLSPDNIDFEDIVLENVSEDDFKVIAEFVGIV